MDTIVIYDIITVKEQHINLNTKIKNFKKKVKMKKEMNTPKNKTSKFPSYLYDPKHHNLKIVRKHWKHN